MLETQVQYISDEKGKLKGVLVPVELWQAILLERETAYLMKSEAMRKRLLEAIQRQDGIPLAQALEKLGI